MSGRVGVIVELVDVIGDVLLKSLFNGRLSRWIFLIIEAATVISNMLLESLLHDIA